MGVNISDWSISDSEKNRLINVLTDVLAVLRAKIGISQDELAKIVGISRQTYGDIERKRKCLGIHIYL